MLNKYDPFAVAVKNRDNLLLGYLPKECSRFYTNLLREGNTGRCHVYNITKLRDGELSIKLKIKIIGRVRTIIYDTIWPCKDWCIELQSYGGVKYDFWFKIFAKSTEALKEEEIVKKYLQSIPPEQLVPYMINHRQTDEYICDCDKCRWTKIDYISVKRISFDEYRVKFLKTDKDGKQEKHNDILVVQCKSHSIINKANEQENNGLIDEAIELYKDSLNYLSDVDYLMNVANRLRIIYTSGYMLDKALEAQLLVQKTFIKYYSEYLTNQYIVYDYKSLEQSINDTEKKLAEENARPLKRRLSNAKSNLRSLNVSLSEAVHSGQEARSYLLAWKINRCEEKIETLKALIEENE